MFQWVFQQFVDGQFKKCTLLIEPLFFLKENAGTETTNRLYMSQSTEKCAGSEIFHLYFKMRWFATDCHEDWISVFVLLKTHRILFRQARTTTNSDGSNSLSTLRVREIFMLFCFNIVVFGCRHYCCLCMPRFLPQWCFIMLRAFVCIACWYLLLFIFVLPSEFCLFGLMVELRWGGSTDW